MTYQTSQEELYTETSMLSLTDSERSSEKVQMSSISSASMLSDTEKSSLPSGSVSSVNFLFLVPNA